MFHLFQFLGDFVWNCVNWYLTPYIFINVTHIDSVLSLFLSKVIRVCFGFALLCLVMGLKNSRDFLSQSVRNNPKSIRDSVTHVFPRFLPASCICFEFWLVQWIVCILCDWLAWLLWFWCHDTQLKIAPVVGMPPCNSSTMSLPFKPQYPRTNSPDCMISIRFLIVLVGRIC